MKSPPTWTQKQLEADAAASSAIFRSERLDEPLEAWRSAFQEHYRRFEELFEKYDVDHPKNITENQLATILKDKMGDLLRYLAGPPISEDDLRVLADTSLAPGVVEKNPEAARRVLDTIIHAIDPCRFPWIVEKRTPKPDERPSAILASAALLTAQRVATARRNEGKNTQESLVREHLKSIGFHEVQPRAIPTFTDAPAPGEFCTETLVGSRKADISVRLRDGRLMAIECKVSNSALNSVKRVNNDAAVKARIWREEFGKNHVVPTAVLSGVFNVPNLLQAQDGGLTLIWAHNLDALTDFLS